MPSFLVTFFSRTGFRGGAFSTSAVARASVRRCCWRWAPSGFDALDHRPEVLELARMKHGKQGLDFHVMFWEELDFDDDVFDMVVCLDPSSPVTDPNLLGEIARVLRPGGGVRLRDRAAQGAGDGVDPAPLRL